MELKKLTESVYYIPSSTNIGVIRAGNSAILIDSGVDEEVAKKILKTLEEHGMTIRSIINTHSHADHCGGNKYIKTRTNASIYAPEIESAIIQWPFFEPFSFFSGARPLSDLENKFLMAQPSSVDYIITKEEKLKLEEVEVRIVRLPGHSPNQIGIEADNILFCGDALFSEEVIRRHKIPFFTDIEKELETLKFLAGSKYRFYVPSHATPSKSLIELVEENRRTISEIEKFILENLGSRKTTEQVLRDICATYQIEIKGAQQYYLMNTTIMAYLSYLHKRGSINFKVEKNALLWEKN